MTHHFKANGKLLITGEYLVMEGAKALALPLKRGQQLHISPNNSQQLRWKAIHEKGLWFEATFSLPKLEILTSSQLKLGIRLQEILKFTQGLSGQFLSQSNGFDIESYMDFLPEYGFGSSSTLIANLASWSAADPFELQRLSFGGSGYDIACATATGPIVYCLINGQPFTVDAAFNPSFSEKLFFVYLGKKQRSSQSILEFQQKASFKQSHIQQVNELTAQFIQATNLETFESLVHEHETLMSSILKRPRVQSQLFANYEGSVKSLGGWGGDFVLVSSHMPPEDFKLDMKKRGFETCFSYESLVLNSQS